MASAAETTSSSAAAPFRVVPVPVLQDNYAYLLICNSTGEVAAVDPAEPKKVLDALAVEQKQASLKLTTVLTTHKHWDHAGGNEAMVQLAKGVRVIGGKLDDVTAMTHGVSDGDDVQVGALNIRCIHVPCHTAGHMLFYVTAPKSKSSDCAVFSGDTLFNGGCGRFFEGTATQMHQALCSKAAALPDRCVVWCGHEYTLNNYRFARAVEPKNAELEAANKIAMKQREQGLPTVPTTIGKEKQTNPFMRVTEEAVKAYTKQGDPVEVMAALRKMKNEFGLGAGK